MKLILNTFSSWLNFVAKYVLNLKLDKSRFVDKSMTGIQGQELKERISLNSIISIKTFNEVAIKGEFLFSCICYCS